MLVNKVEKLMKATQEVVVNARLMGVAALRLVAVLSHPCKLFRTCCEAGSSLYGSLLSKAERPLIHRPAHGLPVRESKGPFH